MTTTESPTLGAHIYYAEVGYSYGGGFAIGATPKQALAEARRHVGATARTERASYVLEFPAAAQVRLGSDINGGWRSDLAAPALPRISADDLRLLAGEGGGRAEVL